jgi:hypothetical protein
LCGNTAYFASRLDQVVLVDGPALLSALRSPLVSTDDHSVVGRESLGVRSHRLGGARRMVSTNRFRPVPPRECWCYFTRREESWQIGRQQVASGSRSAVRFVIAGIVIAIFWSVILGIIVALIGLLAFGGFAKGRWY